MNVPRGNAIRRRGLVSAAGASAAAFAVLGLAQQVIAKFDLRLEANFLLVLVTGVAGWWAQRLGVLGRRAEEARVRERESNEALAIWPVPTVSESNPFDLGVYPSFGPHDAFYLARDVDTQVREALTHTTFTLLYGPPGSGKSRTAFEGLRRLHGNALVLVAEDATALTRLTAAPPPLDVGPDGVVLWLDGLERFLEGLSLEALVGLATPGTPFLVVATIDEGVLRELVASPGQQGHTARRFLARAVTIHVPAKLRAGELAAARGAPHAAGLDFSDGFASARAEARGLPSTPAYRVALPLPAPSRRERVRARLRALPAWPLHADLPALILATAGLLVLGRLVWIGETQGLITPPPVATQLSDLRRALNSCGLRLSTTSAKAIDRGDPLIVATDPRHACSARADPSRPVLIYDKRHDRLQRVAAFGPPLDLLSGGFSFECRGPDVVDRCWSIGIGAGVGVFRSHVLRAVLPVGIGKTRGHFVASPLLSRPPVLRRPFASMLYQRPRRLSPDTGTGYLAADVALVSAPAGDDVDSPRFVAGFTPANQIFTPRVLRVQAHLLEPTADGRVALGGHCIPVRPSRGVETIGVPAGKPLDVLLARTWGALEGTTKTVCF